MRWLGGVLSIWLILCLVGCVQGDSELTLNADGSGGLHVVMDIVPQAVQTLEDMALMPNAQVMRPWPPTQKSLRQAIEGIGLVPGKITVNSRPDGSLHIDATATFSDVHRLAYLPQVHLTAPSIFMDQKGDVVYEVPTGYRGFGPNLAARLAPVASPEMQFLMERFMARGAKTALKVTLPGKILQTNGKKLGDKTVQWQVDVDNLTYDKARTDFWAAIPADSVKFSLPVGPPPSQPSAPPPPVLQEQTPDGYGLKVTAVRTDRTLTPSRGRSEGTVTLALALTPPSANTVPLLCQGGDFDHVLTRDGRQLRLARDPSLRRLRSATGISYEVDMTLGVLRGGGAALPELKGTLSLLTSTGISSVRFGPLKDLVGKQLQSAELSGMQVRLRSVGGGVVDIWADKPATELIRGLRFEQANGTPVKVTGGSQNKEQTGWDFRYKMAVDPAGSLILEVYSRRKKVTIPVDFKEVPLP